MLENVNLSLICIFSDSLIGTTKRDFKKKMQNK